MIHFKDIDREKFRKYYDMIENNITKEEYVEKLKESRNWLRIMTIS